MRIREREIYSILFYSLLFYSLLKKVRFFCILSGFFASFARFFGVFASFFRVKLHVLNPQPTT